MKPSVKVKKVTNAYNTVVRRITGNKYYKMEVAPFGKTWSRCVSVEEACRREGLGLVEYMVLAQERFGLDWVRRTLKMEFVPLAIAVSEGTLNWVLKVQIRALKGRKSDLRAESFRNILQSFPKEIVESLILEMQKGEERGPEGSTE